MFMKKFERGNKNGKKSLLFTIYLELPPNKLLFVYRIENTTYEWLDFKSK